MTARTSPTAYSYIRFSSKPQEEGDSIRRQTEAARAWAERNKVPLDTSLQIDRGISAFKGKNADVGALGEFLKLVERGRVRPGDYLVVEALDRLTRDDVDEALLLLLGMTKAGVKIVQLTPVEVVYFKPVDPLKLMMMVMELMRGNSESATKSQRVGKAWAQKREKARGGEPMTDRLPAWVRRRGETLELVPERARVVRLIFELAAAGYSAGALVARLVRDRVPPFGPDGKDGEPARWNRAYVCRILYDRRALGELKPSVGEVIPGYYPAVVTDAEFNAARSGAGERKHSLGRRPRGKNCKASAVCEAFAELGLEAGNDAVAAWCEKNRKLTVSRTVIWRERCRLEGKPTEPARPREGGEVNLFKSLVVHARDGDHYQLTQRLSKAPGRPTRRFGVLVNSRATQGGQTAYSLPYDVFQDALLSRLVEIDPKEIVNGGQPEDEVLALTQQLDGVERELADANGFMDANGFSASIGKRIKTLESRKDDLEAALAAARQRVAHPLTETWGELPSLVQLLRDAADREDARVRLRSVLRRLVAAVYLLVVPRGLERLFAVQVVFRGERDGLRRDYLGLYRPAAGRRPGGWWVRSLAEVARPGDFDLRKPDHARELEEVLLGTDLAGITGEGEGRR
jgi:DNA invertase Pin-like site-specific DNA recombinase